MRPVYRTIFNGLILFTLSMNFYTISVTKGKLQPFPLGDVSAPFSVCQAAAIFLQVRRGILLQLLLLHYITCVYSYINELQIYIIPIVMTKKVTNEVTQKSKEANVHDLYV